MKFILLFLLGIVSSCSQLPTKRTDKLSILQGITNSKEVEFSIVAPSDLTLRFELRSYEGDILNPEEAKIVNRAFSPYSVHKIVFVRDPLKEYNLYAFEGEKIVDQRLVGRGQKTGSKLRIVVASGLDDFKPKQFKIWDSIVKKNPEYLLLIGDNVYTDMQSSGQNQSTTPEIIWKRYVDSRLTLPLYFEEKLIPTHAIWNDHDYGLNDGGTEFKYKNESKDVFDAFYAQNISEDDYVKGVGVGGLLTLGDFNFYFLDGRSFRQRDSGKKHLGLDQEAWLYSKLREEATPSFIVKGDQFFGGFHSFDSFEGRNSLDFQLFINELKKINTPFIFLSGDRQMSEIMQFPRGMFGKPSFEITSSPLHSKVLDTESVVSNPWRVVEESGHTNFVMIDNLAENNHWFLDVESIGMNGESYFRREVAVYIKDLQDNLNEIRKRRSGKRRYKRSGRR